MGCVVEVVEICVLVFDCCYCWYIGNIGGDVVELDDVKEGKLGCVEDVWRVEYLDLIYECWVGRYVGLF